jgi:hypothetical protein
MDQSFQVQYDAASGFVHSLKLYGEELLDTATPCTSELWVNGLPLKMRSHRDPHDPSRDLTHLKGERFVDHFSGWGLVLKRTIGDRPGLGHHRDASRSRGHDLHAFTSRQTCRRAIRPRAAGSSCRSPLRATPAREDAAPPSRLGESRELARLA